MDEKRFEIDIFHPGDAEGVAKLFTAIYGKGYPVKIVYSPEQLIGAFETKNNIPVVARTPEGDIIGYVAMFRSAPHQKLYEAGQGLVLPDYRNMGIAAAMNRYLCDIVAAEFHIDAIFGEAVCNHTHMQRAWAEYEPIETAIEVDLMPAEAYTKEKSASGRVSTLDMFKTYISRPHTLYIPPVYNDIIRYIYSAYDDARAFAVSSGRPPANVRTNHTVQVFDFAQVARVAVFEAGFDFEDIFDNEEKELLDQGLLVIQVWLKISCPWIDSAVQFLRRKGYFFGGALPRWFDDDGLLMQKIVGTPNWEGIQLYSERAEKILDFVKTDSEITSGKINNL
ncbi:MAG: GNAT family N-acetyltransferase [Proteobacteria bacterium]|nr:GNAT family N-acetyltransferase [Pseudomonadota bacterium]